jgi:syntaxin 6
LFLETLNKTKLKTFNIFQAKVLHMSNDRRQWMAIGALSSAMVVIIIMILAL